MNSLMLRLNLLALLPALIAMLIASAAAFVHFDEQSAAIRDAALVNAVDAIAADVKGWVEVGDHETVKLVAQKFFDDRNWVVALAVNGKEGPLVKLSRGKTGDTIEKTVDMGAFEIVLEIVPEQYTEQSASYLPFIVVMTSFFGAILSAFWIKQLVVKPLNQANAEVVQLRDRFLRVIAHELRSPIAAAVGYLRFIVYNTDARKAEMRLLKGLALLDGLLQVEKAKSGTFKPLSQPVKISTLVRSTAENGEPKATAKGLVIEIAEGTPNETVMIDQDAIEIILNNLLDNAIK